MEDAAQASGDGASVHFDGMGRDATNDLCMVSCCPFFQMYNLFF